MTKVFIRAPYNYDEHAVSEETAISVSVNLSLNYNLPTNPTFKESHEIKVIKNFN